MSDEHVAHQLAKLDKMAGVPIETLPTDLVLLILRWLSTPDQAALARTNKFFHWVINPVLYADNVKHGHSSCLFEAAKAGVVGTFEYALAAGAKVDSYFVHPSAAAASSDAGSVADGPTGASDDNAANNQRSGGDSGNQVTENSDVSYTPLHAAAKHNQADVARWLLDHGADANAPSWKFCSCQYADTEHIMQSQFAPSPFWRPLHTALCHKSSAVAEVLIARGANVHSVSDETGRQVPALALAARHGLVSIVKLLALDVDLDVDAPDYDESTPLHYAALHWRDEDDDENTYFGLSPVPKLLVLGADIDAPNKAGFSPLLHACYRGNFDVAKILLSAGARLDSPGHRRFSIGHADEGDVKELNTPLYYCCLTRGGIADNCCGRRPPLEHSIYSSSRLSLMKMLLDRGAEVDARVKGKTPLMYACRTYPPMTDSARTLLDAGANINARSDDGRTPLHFLLQSWRQKPDNSNPSEPWLLAEAVCLLIKRGARLDIMDWPEGHSPLSLLRDAKYQRLGTMRDVANIATTANISRTHLALALEEEAKKPNSWCIYPLLLLARRIYGMPASVVRHLLEMHMDHMDTGSLSDTSSSSDSDSDAGDNNGSSNNGNNNNNNSGNNKKKQDVETKVDGYPTTTFQALVKFRMSSRSNDVIFLRTLQKRISSLCVPALKLGVAVPGVVLPHGNRTYLHLAAAWGHLPTVEALLERGADIDVFDDFLQTPLAAAVLENDEDTADVLMRDGADPYLVPPTEVLQRLCRRQAIDDDSSDDEDYGSRPSTRRTSRAAEAEVAAAAAAKLSMYLTPFEIAIRDRRVAILEKMLARYLLPEIPAKTPYSYLHRACDVGELDVLELLLKKGAPADGGEGCPHPPAVYVVRRMIANRDPPAVAMRAFEAVKLLVQHGADPNLKDRRGRSVTSLLDDLTATANPDNDNKGGDRHIRRLDELFRIKRSKNKGAYFEPKDKPEYKMGRDW